MNQRLIQIDFMEMGIKTLIVFKKILFLLLCMKSQHNLTNIFLNTVVNHVPPLRGENCPKGQVSRRSAGAESKPSCQNWSWTQFHEGVTYEEAKCPWKTCIFFKMKMYGLLLCPRSSLGEAK